MKFPKLSSKDFIALYLIISSSIYLGVITFFSIPEANIRFADTVLGFILGTVITIILHHYFKDGKPNEDPKYREALLELHQYAKDQQPK